MKTAIQPTRKDNYPEWYQQVIKAGDLAEPAPVRGCMTIKPWGFAIWEAIQKELNKRFQKTGVENIYCPMFIPLRFLEQEAAHVDGFAKECAVVTHHRLKAQPDGTLIPDGALTEPLVVRPTSETLIGDLFARWIKSYRDLPLLVNQWANIVRWEMRTRMFLRTSEFLWQEGHTAHADAAEANNQALEKLELYADFCQKHLAMPVIMGEKTATERFPGADQTLCIEAMMQDGKALQAGTSHCLGQNFAKAFSIQYLGEDGQQHHCYTTSWGVSTRLIGGIIMTHGDDDGLRLPPKIAPSQIIIMPIYHKDTDADALNAYCQQIATALDQCQYAGEALRVKIDYRPLRGGDKAWQWVKKGAPIRLEIGQKELANQTVYLGRRDLTYKEKTTLSLSEFCQHAEQILTEIQEHYFEEAVARQDAMTTVIDNKDDFYQFFKTQIGFVAGYWVEDATLEAQIKTDLGVTVRCFPLAHTQQGPCLMTGQPHGRWTIFAKAY